ncbi:MAG: hypothetical protein JKY61_04345 [Planctomycetes bacterium]|nr:hypothetical protein [Planctomycetota bacterium]
MNDNTHQPKADTERKRLVLMRGLPSCGKSWTAKRIAEAGQGTVIEFDSFFEEHAEVAGGETRFVWDPARLPEARQWHFGRVRTAIEAGTSPIVIDDDHRPGVTAKTITAFAMLHNYSVEFSEPESSWWKMIAPLLADKDSPKNQALLGNWAQKLCVMSRNTHRVPLSTFVARMDDWIAEISPLDLLSWHETPRDGESKESEVAA